MSISKIRTWPADFPRHLPQKHGKKRWSLERWQTNDLSKSHSTRDFGSAKRFRIRFGPFCIHGEKQDISLQSTTSWKVKLFLGRFYKKGFFWMGNYLDVNKSYISISSRNTGIFIYCRLYIMCYILFIVYTIYIYILDICIYIYINIKI